MFLCSAFSKTRDLYFLLSAFDHLTFSLWRVRFFSSVFSSVSGSNYYVRILSTIDRELLKPNASVALHKHSNALVDVLPPEADSSIMMLTSGTLRPAARRRNSRTAVTFWGTGPRWCCCALSNNLSVFSDQKPDVMYADIGGMDIQKQEVREAVELPLTHFELYKQVRSLSSSSLFPNYSKTSTETQLQLQVWVFWPRVWFV